MKITLIAATKTFDNNISKALGFSRLDVLVDDIDHLAETAGRVCYMSFHRPNEKTAQNHDYLANVISQGHESVLAHGSMTLLAEGVSRSLTHELIRSRFLSFSELSQRYVNMDDYHTVIPPAADGDSEAEEIIREAHEYAREAYERLVKRFEDRGLSRKQAREAARCVLPGGMETKIIVSGNMRAWRDFIRQRLTPHADAEMQRFAYWAYHYAYKVAPGTMGDLHELADEFEKRFPKYKI